MLIAAELGLNLFRARPSWPVTRCDIQVRRVGSTCGKLLSCALLLFSLTVPLSGFQRERPAAEAALGSHTNQKSGTNQRVLNPEDGRIRFEDLVEKSGVKFELKNGISPQRYSIETMLGGVAVFDYNNDGLLDIFFTNGAAIPSL